MRPFSQATEYGLITYRSHLEAETAEFLDAAGVLYVYEPTSVRLTTPRGESTLYTPDFILPELGVVLETKGDLSDASLSKLALLARSPRALGRLSVEYMRGRFPILVALSRTGMAFYRPTSPHGTVAICGDCGRLYWTPVPKGRCVLCGGPPGRVMRAAVGDCGLEALRRFYASASREVIA